MHGIERTRNLQGEDASIHNVRRIVVRYADGGAISYEPDHSDGSLSEDDTMEIAKTFGRASAVAEWMEVEELAKKNGA